MPLSRPLPGAEAPFGQTVPPARLVPPSWFLTTMTVSSAREGTGLLHPATDRGFAAFPDVRGPYRPLRGAAGTGPWGHSPRRGSHPPKTSLADSRTASLRPLPSCRYRRCPVPGPGRSHDPFSVPGWPRPPGSVASRAPRSVVGGRQRSDARFDDAPIRRSGPPRHRAHAAPAAPRRRVGSSR
jgi:hypothetical protein